MRTLQMDEFYDHSSKISIRHILFYLEPVHRLNLVCNLPLIVFGNGKKKYLFLKTLVLLEFTKTQSKKMYVVSSSAGLIYRTLTR